MATKPEIKKDVKTEARPKMMKFAFTKKNYTVLIAGVVILVIGFLTLSGGGSKDPNQFSDDLFSPRRMVVAPLILLIGYIVVAYSIMIKEPETTNEDNQ